MVETVNYKYWTKQNLQLLFDPVSRTSGDVLKLPVLSTLVQNSKIFQFAII